MQMSIQLGIGIHVTGKATLRIQLSMCMRKQHGPLMESFLKIKPACNNVSIEQVQKAWHSTSTFEGGVIMKRQCFVVKGFVCLFFCFFLMPTECR